MRRVDDRLSTLWDGGLIGRLRAHPSLVHGLPALFAGMSGLGTSVLLRKALARGQLYLSAESFRLFCTPLLIEIAEDSALGDGPRCSAIGELRELAHDPRALRTLLRISAAREESNQVRRAATEALRVASDDSRVRESMLDLVTSRDADTQDVAVEVLSSALTDDVVEFLCFAALDEEYGDSMRSGFLAGLQAASSNPRVRRLALSFIEDTEADPVLRSGAVTCLSGVAADSTVYPALMRMLDENLSDNEEFPYYSEGFDDLEKTVVETLELVIGEPRVLETLVAVAADGSLDSDFRYNAARVLRSEVSNPVVRELMLRLARDRGAKWAQVEAISILQVADDAAARRTLVEVAMSEVESGPAREAAVRALHDVTKLPDVLPAIAKLATFTVSDLTSRDWSKAGGLVEHFAMENLAHAAAHPAVAEELIKTAGNTEIYDGVRDTAVYGLSAYAIGQPGIRELLVSIARESHISFFVGRYAVRGLKAYVDDPEVQRVLMDVFSKKCVESLGYATEGLTAVASNDEVSEFLMRTVRAELARYRTQKREERQDAGFKVSAAIKALSGGVERVDVRDFLIELADGSEDWRSAAISSLACATDDARVRSLLTGCVREWSTVPPRTLETAMLALADSREVRDLLLDLVLEPEAPVLARSGAVNTISQALLASADVVDWLKARMRQKNIPEDTVAELIHPEPPGFVVWRDLSTSSRPTVPLGGMATN